MCAQPLPDWMRPPPEGFTAEDLDRLPDLPPHTELMDGSLVLVSPQKAFHSLVVDLLVSTLRLLAPEGLLVRREMTVILDSGHRPEPDVMVVNASADHGLDQTAYNAEGVELVIEVVSPESGDRDRDHKPRMYARAGIPHFWRVEENSGRPLVHVYALDPATKSYSVTGIYHDRLKLTDPFDVDIDLTDIRRL